MKWLWKVVFLVQALALFSCSKELSDCFKGKGDKTVREKEVGYFRSVRLENNINMVLHQDTFCHVRIECGSGILEDIKTEVEQGKLRIWNNSSCNWVRDLNPQINIHVYYISLEQIDYSSTGLITCEDSIIEQKFTLDVRDGAGSIDLKANIDTGFFNQHDGVADITLSGKVNAQFIYNNGLGPINALGMESKYTYVNNRGTNDCYVNVSEHLEAKIEYFGNVYYIGNPPVIITWIEGSGNLIKYGP
ncbi:MAG: head GIN domain-containing protein [Bacteroidales bacterium]